MNLKNKKILPFVLMAVCVLIFLVFFRDISPEDIIGMRPENAVLTVIFICGVYIFKSFVIVFPIVVLYAAGGILFPGLPGFLVNLLGTVCCITVPYCIGRYSGPAYIEKLLNKYPKLKFLDELQQENPLIFCYMARIIIFLPADAVSLYLGASEIAYIPFIIGSIVGMLPGILAISFLGAGIADPKSPEFISAFVFMFILVAVSFLGYIFYRKKGRKTAE